MMHQVWKNERPNHAEQKNTTLYMQVDRAGI